MITGDFPRAWSGISSIIMELRLALVSDLSR